MTTEQFTASTGDRIERLRQALIGNGALEREVAEALGKSRRSVQRLGLPFRKVGATRVYDVTASRLALDHTSTVSRQRRTSLGAE